MVNSTDNSSREEILDKNQEDQRYSFTMNDYEKKLQENSEDFFIDLCQNMIANRFEIASNYFKKQSKDYNIASTSNFSNYKSQLQKKLLANDNLSILEQAKLDEQNALLISKQTIENMNRMLEEQNKAIARFASVTDSHTKICICYNKITNLIQIEPHFIQVCEKYSPTLKSILANINVIMELCKSGALTDQEVKQAQILFFNIDNIYNKINEEINEIKQQELIKKQKEEEEMKIKEQEIKRIEKAVEKTQPENVPEENRTQPVFYSTKNYSHYMELKNFLEEYESLFKELIDNVNFKKFRFDCQKAVNTPLNAVSSVSGVHIRDKYDKLSKLLKGERVQVLNTYVQATQHPQGLFYCTALLAKKIVRQGDLLVSSNPEAAFPLAAITIALWSQFPEFGKLLEANFFKQCPYLVPMFLPQKEGQTDKEFYVSRGYTYNEEGVVEKQDKFLKRMSGIFRLYCAIWLAKTPKFLNTSNPCSLKFAWQWLASFLNLKPEPDISATLLHDFLDVCGSEFFQHYGQQFIKIIKLISKEYLAILQGIDEGGPKTRLEVFLQDVLKTGHIPPPNGLLPANTW